LAVEIENMFVEQGEIGKVFMESEKCSEIGEI